MSLLQGRSRGRAFFRFLFAVAWWVAVYVLSEKAAHGFTHGFAFPLLRNLFEIFLLLLGYSYMAIAWEGARQPLAAAGLPGRRGAGREFLLGTALGWGMVTAVVLTVALAGKFYIRISSSPHAWMLLILHVCILATASLAAEIAFRGYPFQQLIQTAGPAAAAILAAIFFGLIRIEVPGATPAALWVSGVAALVLAVAYLRTRALWLCWGLHFSWLASIAILFGQPLAANRRASSVIQTYADGPSWLTGSEYGPEASLVTLAVLWIGLYFVFRCTRGVAREGSVPEPGLAGVVADFGKPFPAAPPHAAFGSAPYPGPVFSPVHSSPPVEIPAAPEAGSSAPPQAPDLPGAAPPEPAPDRPGSV